MLHHQVLGLASIAQDVTPELARATIASISVLGALHASPRSRPLLPIRDEVKTMLNQDTFRESTRLTHAANWPKPRAPSAHARGERAPDATTATPGRISLPGREPPTIDAKANDVEETDRAPPGAGPIRSTARLQRYSIGKGWLCSECEA